MPSGSRFRSQANSQGGSPADLRYADLGIERGSDHEAPAWAINLTHKMGRTWIPLFRKDSRNAARFLEKLRVVEDDKPPMQQFLLLIDVLDWWEKGLPSPSEQCVVLESGLQNILFGILLDKRTFEAHVEDTPLMNRPWFLGVIFRILLYLVQVAASPITFSDDGQQYINAALDQLDMVFKVLWEQRDVLYQPLSPRRGDMLTEETDLRVAVGPVEIVNFVSQWLRLYKLSRSKYPNGAYVVRLFLQLWILDVYDPESVVDIARRVSLARDTLAYAPHSRREATEEVLRTAGPIRFVTTACRVLVEEVTLVDLKLVKVLAMIACVYIDSPQLAEVGIGDEGGNHTDVLRAMLVACQRQLCHGSQVHDEHGIALAVPLIGELLQCRQRSHLPPTWNYIHKLNILPIMAQGCLLPLMEHGPYTTLGAITTLMEAHVSLIAKELGDNPHSRSIKRFKRTIRSIWYPTLCKMHSLSSLPVTQGAPPPRHPLPSWIEIGSLLGLNGINESLEYPLLLQAAQARHACTSSKRCHWLHCLCSNKHIPPIHPFRRKCTGCKQVYYCTSRCQRNDWEEGHREQCRLLRDRRRVRPPKL